MIVVIVVIIVAAVLVLGGWLLSRRRRANDGVDTFRRQIDALSPEARRPVVDQVQSVSVRNDDTDDQTKPSDAADDTGGGSADEPTVDPVMDDDPSDETKGEDGLRGT